jgi:hypothetical protein
MSSDGNDKSQLGYAHPSQKRLVACRATLLAHSSIGDASLAAHRSRELRATDATIVVPINRVE